MGLLSSNDDNNIDPIKSIVEHLLALDGKYCAHLNVFLAADFLMEVRNRQLYSQVDGEILERLGELAEFWLSNYDFWTMQQNACQSTGRIWQDEQSGYKKLRKLVAQDN